MKDIEDDAMQFEDKVNDVKYVYRKPTEKGKYTLIIGSLNYILNIKKNDEEIQMKTKDEK